MCLAARWGGHWPGTSLGPVSGVVSGELSTSWGRKKWVKSTSGGIDVVAYALLHLKVRTGRFFGEIQWDGCGSALVPYALHHNKCTSWFFGKVYSVKHSGKDMLLLW